MSNKEILEKIDKKHPRWDYNKRFDAAMTKIKIERPFQNDSEIQNEANDIRERLTNFLISKVLNSDI